MHPRQNQHMGGIKSVAHEPKGFTVRPLPPPEDGEEPPEPDFKLYTDRELTARGYEWATSLYPVCLGGESTQPTEPED